MENEEKEKREFESNVPENFEKLMELVKRFPVTNIRHDEPKESVWTLAE